MELVGLEGHHNDDQDDDHDVWHDGTELIFLSVTGSVDICHCGDFQECKRRCQKWNGLYGCKTKYATMSPVYLSIHQFSEHQYI